MPRDSLLAVAFTDLNGNDKYNPGKDALIAAIVDTNNDNTVSVGDTIKWAHTQQSQTEVQAEPAVYTRVLATQSQMSS